MVRHTNDWDTFKNQVLSEKYKVMDSIFAGGEGYGNSFLYNIPNLFCQAENERIMLPARPICWLERAG